MKKIVIFSVDLKDLSNFSFFPGAEAFKEKYAQYEYQYSYFSFDIEKDNWLDVENELQLLKLNYGKYFEIKLDDNEIIAYSVFNWTIPSLYDLITGEKQDIFDSAEMINSPIAQDFNSGLLVAELRIIEALAELNSQIKPRDDKIFAYKKMKYKILSDLPILESPRIILSAGAVKENLGEYQSTFYAEGWDGRSSLSEEDVDFIHTQHFVASWLFSYKGIQYKQNAPNYLISGEFANKIFKSFKRSIQLTPITFDNI